MINSQDQEDHIELSLTPGQYLRHPKNATGGGGPSAPNKWKRPSQIPLWDKIIALSCVIAVIMDPLFFYIPIVKEEEKCLGKDKSLRNASLLLRALTDVILIVDIIYQVQEAIKTVPTKNTKKAEALDVEKGANDDCVLKKGDFIQFAKEIARKFNQIKKLIAREMPWLSPPIFIDFLALLPIPQVLIVGVFFKLSGFRYLNKRKILNVFLLGQYVPRIYRIHLSSKELRKTTGILIKCASNFFQYILASHILGAFWYFLSIQRESTCWHQACKNYIDVKGCMSIFYCDDRNTTSKDISTFINEQCPFEIPNNATAPFNFGIFLNSLKSGNTGEINFAKKFFHSFWWGLRNLSNFGTNLETSDYEWENCFAILISIIGLLLFLYLIGNVQTLMQLSTTKSEEIRQKIQMRELDIQVWMERNALPNDLKKEILKNIRKKLEENKDANLENLFSILPWKTRRSLKRFLCMETLKKVPKLQNVKAPALKMMCDYLRPVMYAENSYIVRTGEPLDLMLFITQGTIWTFTTSECSNCGAAGRLATTSSSSMIHKTLEKGDFYGDEELLGWASVPNNPFCNLPISTENVKCHTQVEGFALPAKDLSSVASNCKMYWDFGNSEKREEMALSTISTAMLSFRKRTKKAAETPLFLLFPELATHDEEGGQPNQRIVYQRLRPAFHLSHLQTR